MGRVVRRLAVLVLALLLVMVLVGIGVNVALVGRLDRIDGAFDGLPGRPPSAAGQTIVMVGTRPGTSGSDVPWLAGEQSVEAVMLVEVPEDGLSVDVQSLPGRSGVGPLAATSSPSAVVAAVEGWSGRRVDHLVAIDWETFARLSAREGVEADYAYGSRASVQHDYLQVVVENSLHTAMRSRPWQVYGMLSAAVDGTAVDDDWSLVELDRLVLELRDLRSQNIRFAIARPR